MQKFPKDSRDKIERQYASDVLKLFPSYGIFWERIIGDDVTNKESLLPRVPTFPNYYEIRKIRSFIKFQRWLGNINYSIFCNLVSASNHYNEYVKSLPLTNKRNLFWPMEYYESAYLHLGNIIFELRELWNKLNRRGIVQKSIHGIYLTDFLGNNSSNWDELHDEPREFRNCLVHNFRYIYARAEELYFPNKTDSNKIMWQEMTFNYWMRGSNKLKKHINLTMSH